MSLLISAPSATYVWITNYSLLLQPAGYQFVDAPQQQQQRQQHWVCRTAASFAKQQQQRQQHWVCRTAASSAKRAVDRVGSLTCCSLCKLCLLASIYDIDLHYR